MLCREERSTCLSKPRASSQTPKLNCQRITNMMIVVSLQALITLNYSIMLPSLHQFVTNPTADELHTSEENDQPVEEKSTESVGLGDDHNLIRPGLGQSEVFYSWAVTVHSVGVFIASPIAGQLVRLLSYRLCILIASSFLLLGSLIYAFTTRYWMIIVARLLLGAFEGFAVVVLYSYVGKTTAEQSITFKKKKSKHRKASTLRDKIYVAHHAFRGVLYASVFGFLAVMVQFNNIDQFRWPGWFLAFVTVIYVCPVLLILREPPHYSPANKNDDKEKRKLKSKRYNCKSFGWRIITAYGIILFGAYVKGSLFPILDTLLNPILSYNFGFSITEITYFMLVVNIVAYNGSTLLLVILKCAKINNRIIFIVVVGISICGMLISCDWQSIGADPCYNHIIIAHPSPSVMMSGSGSGSLEVEVSPPNNTLSVSTTLSMHEPRSSQIKEHQYTLKEIHVLANVCRGANTSEYTCYWNQYSQFTGKLCAECHPACRSVEKTLNFVQFSIGISLVMTGLAVLPTMAFLTASDYTPKRLQVTVISLITAVSGIARIVTPVWGDWLFERLGKRTFPPLVVIVTTLVLLLMLLVVFHRQLKSHKATAAAHPGVRCRVHVRNGVDQEIQPV